LREAKVTDIDRPKGIFTDDCRQVISSVSPTHTICDIDRHHLIELAIFLAFKIATPIEYISNQYSVFNAFQQFRTLSILVGVT
jgi:hypothetical protein